MPRSSKYLESTNLSIDILSIYNKVVVYRE